MNKHTILFGLSMVTLLTGFVISEPADAAQYTPAKEAKTALTDKDIYRADVPAIRFGDGTKEIIDLKTTEKYSRLNGAEVKNEIDEDVKIAQLGFALLNRDTGLNRGTSLPSDLITLPMRANYTSSPFSGSGWRFAGHWFEPEWEQANIFGGKVIMIPEW